MSQIPGNYLNGQQSVHNEINQYVIEEAGNKQTINELLPDYVEIAPNNESTLCTAIDSPYYKDTVQPELNQPDFINGGNYLLQSQLPNEESMFEQPMDPTPDGYQLPGQTNGCFFEFTQCLSMTSPDNYQYSIQQSHPNNDNEMEWSYEQTNEMQGSQECYNESEIIELGSPNKPIAQQYPDNPKESQEKTVYLLVPTSETANNPQNIRQEENSGFGMNYSNQYNHQNPAPLANNFLANPSQELQDHCAPHEGYQSGNNYNQNFEQGLARMDIHSPSDHINTGYEDNIIKSEEVQSNNQEKTIGPKLKRTRATKQEMSALSDEDKKERKKLGARKNTAEYNRRKKDEKTALEEESKIRSENIAKMKRECNGCVESMHSCNMFISNYPGNDSNFYNLQDNFATYLENHKKSLESIGSNGEIVGLQELLNEARGYYQAAVHNLEQKQKNPNTYGSTKSRAKSEMEVADMKLQIKIIELEDGIYNYHWNRLQMFKEDWSREFQRTLKQNNITLPKIYKMDQNERETIEKLLGFFNLQNPI